MICKPCDAQEFSWAKNSLHLTFATLAWVESFAIKVFYLVKKEKKKKEKNHTIFKFKLDFN